MLSINFQWINWFVSRRSTYHRIRIVSLSLEPRVFQLKSRLFIDIIARWTSVRVTRIRCAFPSSSYHFTKPRVCTILSVPMTPSCPCNIDIRRFSEYLVIFSVYVWHLLVEYLAFVYLVIFSKFYRYLSLCWKRNCIFEYFRKEFSFLLERLSNICLGEQWYDIAEYRRIILHSLKTVNGKTIQFEIWKNSSYFEAAWFINCRLLKLQHRV